MPCSGGRCEWLASIDQTTACHADIGAIIERKIAHSDGDRTLMKWLSDRSRIGTGIRATAPWRLRCGCLVLENDVAESG